MTTQGNRLNRNPDNIIFTITKSSGNLPDGFSPQNPAQTLSIGRCKYWIILVPRFGRVDDRRSSGLAILTTRKLVEADGIEPTTSGLQSRRSPN